MKKISLTVVLTATLFSGYASANTDELKSILNSGDAKKAFEYASSVLDEFEGDPDFDYYYGLSAVESDEYNEAIFAFDRVLLSQPEHRAAKVELARAHFLIGNYEQSEQLFRESLDANPPAEAKAKIEGYLAQIVRKTASASNANDMRVVGRAYFGIGINDNISSSPGIAQGFINNQLITLDPENTSEQESLYNQAGVSLTGNKLIGQKHAFIWGMNLNGVYNHQASDYNRTTQNMSASMKHALSDNHVLSYGGNLSTYVRDGLHYRNSYGGNINLEWIPSKDKKLTLGLYSSQTDHKEVRIVNNGVASVEEADQANLRDVNANGLALRYRYTEPSGNYAFFFSTNYSQRRVVSENQTTQGCSNCRLYDRNSIGWNIGLSLMQKKDHTFGISYQFLRSNYRNLPLPTSASTDDKRKDTLHAIRLTHSWKFADNWLLKNHLHRVDNQANFDVNKFNFTDLGSTVEYRF